jgi:hypothetical protein
MAGGALASCGGWSVLSFLILRPRRSIAVVAALRSTILCAAIIALDRRPITTAQKGRRSPETFQNGQETTPKALSGVDPAKRKFH